MSGSFFEPFDTSVPDRRTFGFGSQDETTNAATTQKPEPEPEPGGERQDPYQVSSTYTAGTYGTLLGLGSTETYPLPDDVTDSADVSPSDEGGEILLAGSLNPLNLFRRGGAPVSRQPWPEVDGLYSDPTVEFFDYTDIVSGFFGVVGELDEFGNRLFTTTLSLPPGLDIDYLDFVDDIEVGKFYEKGEIIGYAGSTDMDQALAEARTDLENARVIFEGSAIQERGRLIDEGERLAQRIGEIEADIGRLETGDEPGYGLLHNIELQKKIIAESAANLGLEVATDLYGNRISYEDWLAITTRELRERRQTDVNDAEIALLQAEQKLSDLQADLAAARSAVDSLRRTGSSDRQLLEALDTIYDPETQTFDYDELRRRREEETLGAMPPAITQLINAVASAKSKIEQFEIERERRAIRAPITGYVNYYDPNGQIDARAGAFIRFNDPGEAENYISAFYMTPSRSEGTGTAIKVPASLADEYFVGETVKVRDNDGGEGQGVVKSKILGRDDGYVRIIIGDLQPAAGSTGQPSSVLRPGDFNPQDRERLLVYTDLNSGPTERTGGSTDNVTFRSVVSSIDEATGYPVQTIQFETETDIIVEAEQVQKTLLFFDHKTKKDVYVGKLRISGSIITDGRTILGFGDDVKAVLDAGDGQSLVLDSSVLKQLLPTGSNIAGRVGVMNSGAQLSVKLDINPLNESVTDNTSVSGGGNIGGKGTLPIKIPGLGWLGISPSVDVGVNAGVGRSVGSFNNSGNNQQEVLVNFVVNGQLPLKSPNAPIIDIIAPSEAETEIAIPSS
ncbi:hypothetical protein [Jannaschia sp. LMIT008]|uniref:hypothetical protein n=1 Tax=Jannaschia maritima TaxID=3032585 RepID=UPI002810B18C|nr:hypothetical protein [Jannaschia sp. LMIT008]